MTKKLFRNAVLFLSLVLSGIFLNSCSFLSPDPNEEMTAKTATISFSISDSLSDAGTRTALPNPDEHDLKKYLYLYNYTLTYVDGSGGEEIIICDDFSYDKFIAESTIRLATGHTYKFTLKAKDGAVTRMEGSSTISLGLNPSPQTVTIVLVPAGDEYGQKLRVDWIVPDDGIITTMRAGISSERGHAEFQSESEILVPKYKFQEYAFSVVPNPFPAGDSRRINDYTGNTVKRIGVTYDNVKTGVSRWLDYKFYDANGILVYESSESVYMIGGKTSSTVIYITPDHYFRRPVTIPVKKDGNPWKDPELEVKLVDEKGNEYIFTPVIENGNPTGKFEGLLPGALTGDGSSSTDGIFDIYVALEKNDGSENDDFIETGAKYNANDGSITGNGSTDAVELVTVPVPPNGVTLTPTAGVVGTDGGLIVPTGQEFTVKVELDLGYGATGPITVGGESVNADGTVTLKAPVAGGITVSGVSPIDYSIVYKSKGQIIGWESGHEPTATFNIESSEIPLPQESDFAAAYQDSENKIGGWWFGTGTAEDNLDNIIHKINAEKALKEKLIQCAEKNNNTLVLNVYWIKSDFVEYRIEYKFEKLNSDPDAAPEYITDESVVDKFGNKVVSFHNVAVENGHSKEVELPVVPGFTAVEITSGADKETSAEGFVEISLSGTTGGKKEIHYKRNKVTIKLDGNSGKWTDGDLTKTLTGKFGASHDHIADPVREDFRFLGWYVKGDSTQTPIKHVDNHTFPAESIEYVAKWEQTMANYTVEFYYESVDSTAANPKYDKTTHIGKGAVGSFPAFNTTPKDIGFTFIDQKRSITSGGVNVTDVKADGSTLVKLYFDRKTITFTLKAGGGKFTDGRGNTTEEIILEGKYGAVLPVVDSRGFKVDEPEPPVLEGINDGTASRHDFKFHAWHAHAESAENPGSDLEDELPYTFPVENAIYAARWNQLNGIYTVIHQSESLDGKLLAPKAIDGFSGQMLEGSVTKKGKIGSPMVYFHDSVTGFEDPTVEIRNNTGTITGNEGAEKITADEKTEVIVTYLRKEYTINFHLNAGGDTNAKWVTPDERTESSKPVTRTGKFRTDFTPPADPVREHFVFRGWTTKSNGTLEERVDVVPSFTEDAPKDYYAVWYSKASGGLETDTADISLACTVDGTVIKANAGGNILATGDWSYAWSINNVPVLAGATGVTFEHNGKVLTLSGCLKKDYEITVVATHNGKVYTKTKVVTVTGE